MNESWKAGGSDGNDLSLSERVKVRFSLIFFKVGIMGTTQLIFALFICKVLAIC